MASKLLGMVGKTIKSKLPLILISIYKSIVRPHLEFCSSARSHYKEDGELLEKTKSFCENVQSSIETEL